MNELIQYEDSPFDGGVSKLVVSKSADEEVSESEDEVDADFIRSAKNVAAPYVDSLAERAPLRAAPTRLTFHIPNDSDALDSEEDPRPGTTRPLDKCEQFLGVADPPVASKLRNEAGQAAADLLKGFARSN